MRGSSDAQVLMSRVDPLKVAASGRKKEVCHSLRGPDIVGPVISGLTVVHHLTARDG
jgi:hypothetical protein